MFNIFTYNAKTQLSSYQTGALIISAYKDKSSLARVKL